MRYWVYGVDGVSREPRDPLFIEAANEEEARAQAKEMGMAVEQVEAVQPKAAPPSTAVAATPTAPTSPTAEGGRHDADHPVARVLVNVFRIMAGVVALLYLILFFITLDAATKAEEAARRMGSSAAVPVGAALLRLLVEAVLAVSVLLAVAEFLRLGIALERNTRGLGSTGERRKPR